jgi:hypothetical protein
MAIPWILISIAIILVLLFVLMILFRKKVKAPTDYYVFFIIGLTWLPLGLVFKNPALWGMGLVFLIVGLVHKKEWKKNHRPWNKLSKEEKKYRKIIIAALGVLVLVGLVAFLLAHYNVI